MFDRRVSVSVVIPAYNAAAFLAEAIQSVIFQTVPPTEIIVVDDGSSDDSYKVACQFSQVRAFCRPHLGASQARNFGVRQCRGELLAFLDADDLWVPRKLEWQLAESQLVPTARIITGQVEQFVDDGFDAGGQEPPPISSAAIAGTLLISKADFDAVGEFDPSLRLGEFIDWHSRATALGLHTHAVAAVVLKRRIHACNTGRLQRDSRRDYLATIKAHLERKRR